MMSVIMGCLPESQPVSTLHIDETPTLDETPIRFPKPEYVRFPASPTAAESADEVVMAFISDTAGADSWEFDIHLLESTNSTRTPPGYAHPLRAFFVELPLVDSDKLLNHAPEHLTLEVRVDGLRRQGAPVDPFSLVAVRYDELKQEWAEVRSSVDFPWVRIEARTDRLGLFVLSTKCLS